MKSLEEVKERTGAESLFQREKTVVVAGVSFRLRRMTLLEEMEWQRVRSEIMGDGKLDWREKVVRVWEELLRRVVKEPRLESYTEELPAAALARLVEETAKLHLWDMDFRS